MLGVCLLILISIGLRAQDCYVTRYTGNSIKTNIYNSAGQLVGHGYEREVVRLPCPDQQQTVVYGNSYQRQSPPVTTYEQPRSTFSPAATFVAGAVTGFLINSHFNGRRGYGYQNFANPWVADRAFRGWNTGYCGDF